jgi:hypothetical protein
MARFDPATGKYAYTMNRTGMVFRWFVNTLLPLMAGNGVMF